MTTGGRPRRTEQPGRPARTPVTRPAHSLSIALPLPHDFYGRQLNDWKGSAEIEPMTPKAMATYGTLCSWTLAHAHVRSGVRVAIRTGATTNSSRRQQVRADRRPNGALTGAVLDARPRAGTFDRIASSERWASQAGCGKATGADSTLAGHSSSEQGDAPRATIGDDLAANFARIGKRPSEPAAGGEKGSAL